MSPQPLTAEQVEAFDRDGYLIIQDLLNAEETELLASTAKVDAALKQAAMNIEDASGRTTNLTLWNHPGDDIYGVLARSERVVYSMSQLLHDEVYHYHSKLSAKEPRVGGAWEWHQDYGYWYDNGCLFPDMASVFIAIDPCTKENGCLQVLSGSHRLGRIRHGKFGDQTGADPDRVAEVAKRMELVHCEIPAGAALFFHSNLLHCSAANESEFPRWGLLCCYNTRHNDPYKESHHPRYTPLDVLPDSAILEVGAKSADASQSYLSQDDERRQ